MTSRNRFLALLITVLVLLSPFHGSAQDAQTQTEQKKKEQEELVRRALAALDQIILEAPMLRLPENRIRVQSRAAQLLWKHDPARARLLYVEAANGLTELMQVAAPEGQRGFDQNRMRSQLRFELLSAVSSNDPQLALELLRSTKPADSAADVRGRFSDSEVEASLLARIAESDPALALKNSLALVEKGQFSYSLLSVLARLREEDEKMAAELADGMVRRMESRTLLASREASGLSISLLSPGPLPAESSANKDQAAKSPASSAQILKQADYVRLMESVITAALTAQPRTPGSPQQGGFGQGRGQVMRPGALGGPFGQGGQMSEAELAQSNAQVLLSGLQSFLPQVDKYLPSRSTQLRQKLTETGQSQGGRQQFGGPGGLGRDSSVDSLLQAAPTAPPQAQAQIYRQAAMRALGEGDTARAAQIANNNLSGAARDQILQSIERQKVNEKAEAGNVEQTRQMLSRLRTNEERVGALLMLARAARTQNDPKLAAQLLKEAETLLPYRAENYRQLESRTAVAGAYAAVDPAHGLEVLGTCVDQLNELIAAAAILSGFEIEFFREGELPLQGGGGLTAAVESVGFVLGEFIAKDFTAAEAVANRFQRPEPRISVRLSMVQRVLAADDDKQAPAPGTTRRRNVRN